MYGERDNRFDSYDTWKTNSDRPPMRCQFWQHLPTGAVLPPQSIRSFSRSESISSGSPTPRRSSRITTIKTTPPYTPILQIPDPTFTSQTNTVFANQYKEPPTPTQTSFRAITEPFTTPSPREVAPPISPNSIDQPSHFRISRTRGTNHDQNIKEPPTQQSYTDLRNSSKSNPPTNDQHHWRLPVGEVTRPQKVQSVRTPVTAEKPNAISSFAGGYSGYFNNDPTCCRTDGHGSVSSTIGPPIGVINICKRCLPTSKPSNTLVRCADCRQLYIK